MRQPSVPYESVLAAVRRRARREGVILRRCRPGHWNYTYLGDLYTVCEETGFVERSKVNLRDAAIELGVIDAGQEIEQPRASNATRTTTKVILSPKSTPAQPFTKSKN
jgi:hypothetical protein